MLKLAQLQQETIKYLLVPLNICDQEEQYNT